MNVLPIQSIEKASVPEPKTPSAISSQTASAAIDQSYYYSPALVLNPQAGVAVLEYRNPQTGAVINQYPSPQDLKAYEQHKLESVAGAAATKPATPVEAAPVKPAAGSDAATAQTSAPVNDAAVTSQTSTSSIVI